jgi:hypothetical protein
VTRNLDAAEYSCNKCGIDMKFTERKLILAEVGDASFENMDVHICMECKNPVLDFINQPPRPMPKRARDGKFLPSRVRK